VLRRVRGAIGMGLTWAVAWFGAGMVLLLVVGFGAADVPFPLGFGMLAFFAGVLFSGVLGMVERHRGFDQMSLPRFAAWGTVGGFMLSVIDWPRAFSGRLCCWDPCSQWRARAPTTSRAATLRRPGRLPSSTPF